MCIRDRLDTVSFEKDDSGSPNAQQITIGLVNDIQDENGLFEIEWDEGAEIIKASIIIEKDLDEYFLTAVLHEIGNVLGLGDIRTRGDLQSIMEDPYDEIFKDDKLWEFDIKMIYQLYGVYFFLFFFEKVFAKSLYSLNT